MLRTTLLLARQMSTYLSNERRRIKHYVSKDVMEQTLMAGQFCPKAHQPIDSNGPLDLDAYQLTTDNDGGLREYCHMSLLVPMNSFLPPIEHSKVKDGGVFAFVSREQLVKRLGTGQELTMRTLLPFLSCMHGEGYAKKLIFHGGQPVHFSVFQCMANLNRLEEDLLRHQEAGSFKGGNDETVGLKINSHSQITHVFMRAPNGEIIWDGIPTGQDHQGHNREEDRAQTLSLVP